MYTYTPKHKHRYTRQLATHRKLPTTLPAAQSESLMSQMRGRIVAAAVNVQASVPGCRHMLRVQTFV
jgi:hypothetical protein